MQLVKKILNILPTWQLSSRGMPNNKPSVVATGVVVVDASVDDMVVGVGAVVEASETRTNCTRKVREI